MAPDPPPTPSPGGDMSALLADTARRAAEFLSGLDARSVVPRAAREELLAIFGPEMPDIGEPPEVILDRLAAAQVGIMATAGPRFFGFVIGGALPAALAADWLGSAWDQNAALYAASPAGSVVEDVAGGWIVDLLGLPAHASFGFVNGGQAGNTVALAAARHHVLAAAGWDVEADGLRNAPPIAVVTGRERHATIDAAVRHLGLGRSCLVLVDTDSQGRADPRAIGAALDDTEGPAIVCTQAGDVNSGCFDDFPAICDVAGEHDAWVHVDGAIGLWAAASDEHRHLMAGADRADSWSVDAHKLLNVPYGSGVVLCRHPASHLAAMSIQASYLPAADDAPRDPSAWTAELSHRARGFAVWAALRSLGRTGVGALVDRCCAHAREFARLLGDADGVEVLNDVVFDQVLVRFGDDDAQTRAVVAGVQAEGTCWLGGTVWGGRAAMRISVANWSTTTEDVERSAEAILRVHSAIRAAPPTAP